MAKWIKTNFPGVRYREHESRKHGVKRDQYFTIRYKIDGRDREEGLGWSSEGWTPTKAYDHLKELKENRKVGKGPQTLAEKRNFEKERRELEQAEREKLEKENITFNKFFEENYLPWASGNRKDNTIRMEKILHKKWIYPILGTIPLSQIAPVQIEKIKKTMTDQGRSSKTVHHVLSLIRQVYNHAKRQGIFSGDHPVSKVKMPRVDNAKLRYLVPEEIDRLLAALRAKSFHVHDQAVLSVHCGLRFAETAGLRWEDINYETGTISIRDAKTGSRTVFMNDFVVDMLKARQGNETAGLIFPDEKAHRQERISKTFQRIADELFNRDTQDRRLRVTFHTLRHSFGTHVYENTGDLYLTQKALGHKTMTMAQRYAKMSEPRLREAFSLVGNVIKGSRSESTRPDQTDQVVNLNN